MALSMRVLAMVDLTEMKAGMPQRVSPLERVVVFSMSKLTLVAL